MTEQMIEVEGVELCIEEFGAANDEVVLLIAGMASSMDVWDVAFCERLVAAGRRVVRYDHRDTGRSATAPPGAPTYTWVELSKDPQRILDALRVERAHLVGMSMGGAVAQEMAVRRPERVATVTLIATTAAGTRRRADPLPPALPAAAAMFGAEPTELDWSDVDAVVAWLLEIERAFAGGLPFDEVAVRARLESAVRRARDVRSAANHQVLADGDAPPFAMADIRVPVLVVHGTDDPLFPVEHGRALVEEIDGARLLEVAGMGHEVPPRVTWDDVVPVVAAHTAPAPARGGT